MAFATATWDDNTSTDTEAGRHKLTDVKYQLGHMIQTIIKISGKDRQTTANDPAFSNDIIMHWLVSEDMVSVGSEVENIEKTLPGQPNLSSMLSDLLQLFHGEEEDGYGVLRPTKYAFDTTVDLLFNSALGFNLNQALPSGSITTDYEGGIRIEWSKAERNVRLVIPARQDGTHYIYFEDRDIYRTIPTVNAGELLQRLEWLFTA